MISLKQSYKIFLRARLALVGKVRVHLKFGERREYEVLGKQRKWDKNGYQLSLSLSLSQCLKLLRGAKSLTIQPIFSVVFNGDI